MTTSKPSLKRTYAVSTRRPEKAIYKRRYLAPSRRGSVILGNIAGYVARNQTTLARYPGPFQQKKIITFEYQNSLVGIAPGTQTVQYGVAYNDAFDFDKSSVFGNKQPLYYDSLLSASGPYKAYKVKSWICTFTFINAGTNNVSVFVLPPTQSLTEVDSTAEADNMPGVVRGYVTAKDGCKNMISLTTKGTPFDVYDLYGDDANTFGPYNNSPGSLCYGGIFLAADAGNVTGTVAVHCEMVTELSVVDALVS